MSYLGRIAMRAVRSTGGSPASAGLAGEAPGRPAIRSGSPLLEADQRLGLPDFAGVPDADVAGPGEAEDFFDVAPAGPAVAAAPVVVAPTEAARVHPAPVDTTPIAPAAPLVSEAPAPPRASPSVPEPLSTPPFEALFPAAPAPVPSVALPRSRTQSDPPQRPIARAVVASSVAGPPGPEQAVPEPFIFDAPPAVARALESARGWFEAPARSREVAQATPAQASPPQPLAAPFEVETPLREEAPSFAPGLTIGHIHVEVIAPPPVGAAARSSATSAVQGARAPAPRRGGREAAVFGWRQR